MQVILAKKDESGKYPAWAWPGGYPIYYVVDKDCSVICPKCLNERAEELKSEGADRILMDANYEDPELFCDFCNERIESAYAEED